MRRISKPSSSGRRAARGTTGAHTRSNPVEDTPDETRRRPRPGRVRLGTGVLVAPWYRPVVLARSLTSLDVLSDGRLTVGLGAGGSRPDGLAGGASQRALDEALDVLAAVWGDDPVSHDSRYQRIVSSWTGPEPVQKPHPPVLLDGHTAEGLNRVAHRADGWNPANVPIDLLAPLWADVRDRAASHGRNPTPPAGGAGRHRAHRSTGRGPPGAPRGQHRTGRLRRRRHPAGGSARGHPRLSGDHGLNEALEHYAAVAEALDVTAAA